jgi:hypothetical protein
MIHSTKERKREKERERVKSYNKSIYLPPPNIPNLSRNKERKKEK